MKSVTRFLSRGVAAGLAVMLSSWVLPAHAVAKPGTAKVQSIRGGSAQWSEDGKTYKALAIFTSLKAGNTIKTDPGAIVDLFLGANGPVVRVTPSTTLALTALSFEMADEGPVIDTEMGLSNGRILGNVRKLAAASKYEVVTPNGTCGIRGTEFDINANGRVSCISGTVYLTFTPPGQTVPRTVLVQPGFTMDPSTATATSQPTPTPAAQASDAAGQIAVSVRISIPLPVITVTVVPPATPRQQPTGGGNQNIVGQPTIIITPGQPEQLPPPTSP